MKADTRAKQFLRPINEPTVELVEIELAAQQLDLDRSVARPRKEQRRVRLRESER